MRYYIGGDLPKVNQWNTVPKKKQYSFNALFMQGMQIIK